MQLMVYREETHAMRLYITDKVLPKAAYLTTALQALYVELGITPLLTSIQENEL